MAEAGPHRVVVVAVPPVTTFDLSIPELVFPAVDLGGRPAYSVTVCTPDPGVVAGYGSLSVVIEHGLDALADADTVIVTGTGAREEGDPRVLSALRAAAAAGRRIASICTGAFVLAQAGLLDGRPATTYWVYSAQLRSRFPAVDLQPDVLFVDDGAILTSAGLAAGLDLCLHLVRLDHGAVAANAVARLAVSGPARDGLQPQVLGRAVPDPAASWLAATRAWALRALERPLTLGDLARHAAVSTRTLTRRFREETGLSPLQWLLVQRVDRARELLEATDLPLEVVARRSGLGTGESLRLHLVRNTGLTPKSYRTAYARRPPA